MKKAFTMIELIFVIVIIGILSAVAVPKFTATRDDAFHSRARGTVSAVRNALAIERQKRVLRGDFTEITDLSAAGGTKIFTTFSADKAGKYNSILEYPLKSGTKIGSWNKVGSLYIYHYGASASCDYNLTSNKFTVVSSCSVLGD